MGENSQNEGDNGLKRAKDEARSLEGTNEWESERGVGRRRHHCHDSTALALDQYFEIFSSLPACSDPRRNKIFIFISYLSKDQKNYIESSLNNSSKKSIKLACVSQSKVWTTSKFISFTFKSCDRLLSLRCILKVWFIRTATVCASKFFRRFWDFSPHHP